MKLRSIWWYGDVLIGLDFCPLAMRGEGISLYKGAPYSNRENFSLNRKREPMRIENSSREITLPPFPLSPTSQPQILPFHFQLTSQLSHTHKPNSKQNFQSRFRLLLCVIYIRPPLLHASTRNPRYAHYARLLGMLSRAMH